jgi:IS5 family transposase
VPADDLVMGDEKAVYADKAYATHVRRAALKARGIKDRIMHRANKHQPKLPRWQKKRNRLIAKIRARVERTFAIWQRGYSYTRVRYFSLVANAFELQMKCIAFNLRRMAVLTA